jgi:hypothetical protein
MQKVDIRKELKSLYNPSIRQVELVDVPSMTFLMIDGSGDPNTAKEYQEAIEALYSLAYAIKFTVKKELEIDYGVMPLEGLWWTDDMSLFGTSDKHAWKWTAMMMQPEYVSGSLHEKVLEQVKKKKDLPGLAKIRLQTFHEGQSAQIMYIGPYSNEGPTIKIVHDFLKARGLTFDGLKQKHHEIYLGDPRKAAPEKLKTIIRQSAQ